MANTLISFHDLVKHKCKNDCWILINGKVYDVSPFMDEHPGGDNMLLSVTGKDASTDFEEVGHSEDAKELMKKYCIGNVDQSTVPVTKEYIPPWEEKDSTAATAVKTTKEESGTNKMAFLIPLLILGIAFFYRFYYNNK